MKTYDERGRRLRCHVCGAKDKALVRDAAGRAVCGACDCAVSQLDLTLDDARKLPGEKPMSD